MRMIFRKILFFALMVALGAAAGAGSMLLFYRVYPPPTVTASLSTTPTAPGAAAPASSSPSNTPTVPAALPVPAPASATPAPAAGSPGPPALPPLPSEEVHEQPANAVPPGTPPTRSVTIEDRNGHTVTRAGAPGRPAAAEPPPAPSPVPAVPAQTASLPPAGATLVGPATATGAISLAVRGYGVRLFGIAPPGPGDRCLSTRGEAESCSEVTAQVLAARLAHSASITCRLPPNATQGELGRICVDRGGVDIAGYLVGEGLAFADPRQAHDYVGAESIAKTYRKGLWAYR